MTSCRTTATIGMTCFSARPCEVSGWTALGLALPALPLAPLPVELAVETPNLAAGAAGSSCPCNRSRASQAL